MGAAAPLSNGEPRLTPSVEVDARGAADPRCTKTPAGQGLRGEQVGAPVASVSADGAYDTKAVYEAAFVLDRQRVEVQMACGIYNTMTLLGMPDSYRVE